jgi:hypothetical protein
LQQEYKKLEQKRDLVLREYVVETKPDEYEIEYLDISKSEYETISKQIKPILSFQDMGTFQDEKWFVSNLRFYVIKVTPLTGKSIYFYRAYTPKKILSKSPFFAMWRGTNEYDRLKEAVFLFDNHLDCISDGNFMFLLKKENFHYIFHFLDEIKKSAEEALLLIKELIPIVNFDKFACDCKSHPSKLRKLKNISAQPYLHLITIDDIKNVILENNLQNIRIDIVDGKEMLRYDPFDPYGILKLLDDDYLQSIMTNRSYEVNAKRGR